MARHSCSQVWIVETAFRGTPADAPTGALGGEWRLRSFYGADGEASSARAEARQCGPYWRGQGLSVRARTVPCCGEVPPAAA